MDTSKICSRDGLLATISDGWDPDYLFFWGHTPSGPGIGKHVLSQWWPARFVIGGIGYASAEHYMMAEKARLFGDEETRAGILAAPDPARAKALGRRVRGFDDKLWEQRRVPIVVEGSLAKFAQNVELGRYLAGTGDAVLVEASPVDGVWGIGLPADDPRATRPAEWKGLNLLGFALMQARAALSVL